MSTDHDHDHDRPHTDPDPPPVEHTSFFHLRRELGLSRSQAAVALGVGDKKLRQLDQSYEPVRLSELRAAAKLVGVSVAELLAGCIEHPET